MTENERALFEKLAKDRKESAYMLEKTSMRGLKSSVVEKYSDQAHFIYELIQNADDVGATEVRFELFSDRLIFVHNGTRLFTVSDLDTEEEDSKTGKLGDINSITSIANSNKTISSIGKFGVGFKAVFQYTTTPIIYDPNVAFRIERFIVPVIVENTCEFKKPDETAFVFPFNHPDRQKDEAYEDILHKLRNLVFPTLFLNNLKKVSYRCDREFGEYEKKIRIKKYIDDTCAEFLEFKNGHHEYTDKLWLFTRTTEEGYAYSCGFFIDDNYKLINTDYYAFCFFPTKKDTNLNFIINAPFLLTDSREGIKATEGHNIKMIEYLADLAADCFVYLKNLGDEIDVQILDDDIFNYIPIHEDLYTPRNPRDDLSLLPFYEKIKNVFSTEEILPSKDGYVTAKNAYLAYATTTEIISNKQLSYLTKNLEAKWVIPSKGGEALYRTADGRYAYLYSLINKSMIYDYQIYEMFSESFIEKQSIDWLFSLYEFTLDKSSRIEKCKTSPIFIDEKGKAVSAFDKKGNAILFIDDDDNSEYSIVSHILTNNKFTQELMERLNIKAPELKDKIYNVILRKEELDPLSDFKILLDYYIELIENNKDTGHFIDNIRNRAFVLGESEDKSVKDVYLGSDLYLPTKELLYYFSGAGQTAYFVASSEYRKILQPKEMLYFDDFLKRIGVDVNVQLIKQNYTEEEVYALFGQDWHRSNRTPIWYEQYIHCYSLVLDKIRDNEDKELSFYLWNQLLQIFEDHPYDNSFYTGTYEYFYRTEYIQHFTGLGETFIKCSKWIFDKNGKICSPDEISMQEMAYEYNLAGETAKRLVSFLEIKDEHPEYDDLNDELRKKLEKYDRLVGLGVDSLSEEELLGLIKLLKDKRTYFSDEKIKEEVDSTDEMRTEKKILDDIKERIEERPKERTENQNDKQAIDENKSQIKDDDEVTKAPVDFSKKIEAAKEKFETELELLAQIEEAQKIVKSSEKYSYGWFKGLLELEAIENGEENSRSREVSISFSKVEREEDTNRTLILKHPDRNIPQVMEELVDVPLDLSFGDGTSKRLIIEVANVKSYTLRVKVKPDEFINNANFEMVTKAKIVTKNPSFLLRELQNQFKRFETAPYLFNNKYDMQMNLCDNIDFIFGPPGTGKTTYLSNETIIPLVNNNKKLKMIVLAPTNKAADVLVSRIMESMGDNRSYEEWLVRYGVTGDEKIESSPIFKGKEFEIDDYDKCVIVTTMVRFPYDFFIDSDGDFNYLYGINWDYIVVDEASMIPLIYMVYMLYLKTPKKFIIAGDPFQIEPTVAVSDWSGENIYKMINLMDFSSEVDTVPHKYNIKLLTKQYRSIPSIGDVYSKLTYNGVLEHNREEIEQRKLNIDDYIKLDSLNIIKFPVSKYESIYRPKRLKMSNYHVYSALFTFEFSLFLAQAISIKNKEKYSIGIIAPYSSQAGLIDKLIASAELPKNVDIQSGTIHGFQGDECDIIIAVFNPPPYISTNKEMFLNRQNIINVAISRARDYLIVLMPDEKTENVSNLILINNLERLIEAHDCCIYDACDIEELMFDSNTYLEDNAFSTGHQLVNVYGLPEKRYEIRSEDNALDVQVHGISKYIPFDVVIDRETEDNNDNIKLINELKGLLKRGETSKDYFEFFSENGLLVYKYHNYLTTSPIEVKIELERLPKADLKLCYALMTMLFREDHFNNGVFEKRIEDGSVASIVRRIIELLD